MIPTWLQEKLATPPAAGAGIHAWLFSVARQLHAHMPAEAVAAVLQAATANAGRRVTQREIRDAVQNSREVAWRPKDFSGREGSTRPLRGSARVDQSNPDRSSARLSQGNAPAELSDRWPKPDPVARRCRIADSAAEGVGALVDLWEQSPTLPEWTADDWLDWLFPGAEWLCLATDHPATARTRRREKWSFGPADECGLVVPSPMTGPGGKGLDGRTSHRCLDNTGPRKWLVIEFDKMPDGKTDMPIDEQAALHWHFRASSVAAGWPRLKLCVHSGGKSLHGWYGPCDDEERVRDLMAYAASLGADTATFNRCQLVRLPGGVRTDKRPPEAVLPDGWPVETRTRQEVFFFDPTPSCSMNLPSNSSEPGASQDSTPPLALMTG